MRYRDIIDALIEPCCEEFPLGIPFAEPSDYDQQLTLEELEQNYWSP